MIKSFIQPAPVLHCYYQNVRSIKSGFKLKEFKDVVHSSKFDIVAISESWLTSDVSDSELLPWGYDIFRCDRKSLGNCGDTIRGGEVLLATRCDFIWISLLRRGFENSSEFV